VIYEWDIRKAAENLRKHDVSFEEAKTVFLDPFAETFDEARSFRRRAPVHHAWDVEFATSFVRRPCRLRRGSCPDYQRADGYAP
jgi:uncharacterized DUF497 family protein